MTREEFDLSICRLSLLRGAPETGDEHFSALSDLPAEVFERACIHAMKTRAFFPVPAELRRDADAAVVRPIRLVPETDRMVRVAAKRHEIKNPFGGASVFVTVDHEWRHDCDRCRDTGVRSWWCGAEVSARFPDAPLLLCGRVGEHGAHEWVNACDCVEWNPTIRRAKEAREARYSKDAERV